MCVHERAHRRESPCVCELAAIARALVRGLRGWEDMSGARTGEKLYSSLQECVHPCGRCKP